MSEETGFESGAKRLVELWGEIADLEATIQVLSWDQETYMPAAGQAARGSALGTLAGLRHAKLSQTELGDALAAAEACAESGTPTAALARSARRVVDKTRRIPADLARELARAQSRGHAAWRSAHAEANFALFAPELENLVRLSRLEAQALADGTPAADGGEVYDALLDKYEPGAKAADLEPLFRSLLAELTPLVQAVRATGTEIDESPLQGACPRDAQLAFGTRVAKAFGFDFDAGRIDRAPHPFCTSFGTGDVRITWRWNDTDFRPGFFGILHETGHALYEQGLPARWGRTPLGKPVSLGVHESQSRLWENLVGRSRSFWEWALPELHAHFPALSGVTLEQLWPALHTVKPSLIRVEADQGTYDLHVAVRFELERRLIAGDLAVSDLPGAWDEAYERTLGLSPAGPANGVLQDIHWSMAAFGYFPTYTLGNLMMAQLFEAARAELGDLDAAFARGEFAPLLDWLRRNVHGHGHRFRADELMRRATGQPLGAEAFLAQRKALTAEVYGVRV